MSMFSKFWHLIRLHQISTYHRIGGMVHHCTCGRYWIEGGLK